MLVAAIVIPLIAATLSPLLQWRSPVYILAGFAGIIAMVLILFQPLLAAGLLPGINLRAARRIHRWVGGALVLAIIIHVLSLWLTSPPDVIDALLFSSPTPFSLWGVIAMWCVFIITGLVAFRSKLLLNARQWRLLHKSLAAVIVAGSVAHALLIEGTMETISKLVLCTLVIIATLCAFIMRYVASRKRSEFSHNN